VERYVWICEDNGRVVVQYPFFSFFDWFLKLGDDERLEVEELVQSASQYRCLENMACVSELLSVEFIEGKSACIMFLEVV